MREVITVHWCDHHYRTLEHKHHAEPVSITLDGVSASLDLCGEADKEVLGLLRELLAAVGRRATTEGPPPPPAPAPLPLPIPDPDPKREQERAREGQDKPEGGRAEVRTLCGTCNTWMSVRFRTAHATRQHQQTAGSIPWFYGPEVEQVWLCNCGLTFPTRRGRDMHIRQHGPGCGVAEPDTPELPTYAPTA